MRRQPWDPAVVVDDAWARRLITRQFPDLSAKPLTYIGAGWDNTAWRAGDWLFRFPRRGLARALMTTEVEVLPRIAARLPLPISSPERVGHPDDGFPYLWSGYRWMQGTTGCRTQTSDSPDTARQLGAFLRVLHRLPSSAPHDTWRQHLPGQARKLQRTLDDLPEGVLPDVLTVRALADRLAETPHFDGTPVLCHGDLYARHVLFHHGSLCGVIDWGDVHRGDPATDLAVAMMLFDRPHRRLLFDAYGPVDTHTRKRARFRALFSGVFQAHYAHSVGDIDLLRAGRHAVQRALHAEPST